MHLKFYFSCCVVAISYRNQLMHTYVIHTTLLDLCYSNMFWH